MSYRDFTLDYIRSRIHYCPDTGVITWKHFPQHGKAWNTKYAGKVAGNLNTRGRYSRRDISIGNKVMTAHILIWFYMKGEWPVEGYVIDHINRDATDNRWCNLRRVTLSENKKNNSMYSNNSSGITGVFKRKDCDRWAATGRQNGKSKALGLFKTKEEAAAAAKAFRESQGYYEGSGLPRKHQKKNKVKTLNSDNRAGCRFISSTTRGTWAVGIKTNEERVVKYFKCLVEAKTYLKETLDQDENHPYHGLDLPD